MVAALGNLQVGVVAWRELDAGLAEGAGHQVDERVVRLGQVLVHMLHHLLRGMRAGDGQHIRVHALNQVAAAIIGARAQAAGDDDLAVVGQGLANRVQALAHGIVDEAAGVDDDQIRALEGLGGLVALGGELGEYEFGVRQVLGAAQADEADLGVFCRGECFAHPRIFPV